MTNINMPGLLTGEVMPVVTSILGKCSESHIFKKHLGTREEGEFEPYYMNQSAVYSMVSSLAHWLIKR